MDTDSLLLIVYDRDIYEFMKKYPSYFYTSHFEATNRWGIVPQNGNVSGKFKVENANEIITHFVAIRLKVYCYLTSKMTEVRVCKGTKKDVIGKRMRFAHYCECLSGKKVAEYDQVCIRQKEHEVFTIVERKIGLGNHDTKRRILTDNINTEPWGKQ